MLILEESLMNYPELEAILLRGLKHHRSKYWEAQKISNPDWVRQEIQRKAKEEIQNLRKQAKMNDLDHVVETIDESLNGMP